MDDGGGNAESKPATQENSEQSHSETTASYTDEQVEVVNRSAIILLYIYSVIVPWITGEPGIKICEKQAFLFRKRVEFKIKNWTTVSGSAQGHAKPC